MEKVDGLKVDMSQAVTYHKKVLVLALLLANGVEVIKDWGSQNMIPGAFILVDPNGGEAYGIDRQAFFSTYEPVEEKPGFYRKIGTIRAVQMSAPFEVISQDNAKKPEEGDAGDWLVENTTPRPDGSPDRYLIRKDKFERLYEPVPEKTNELS